MAGSAAAIELTREELYKRVWSTPMSKLAAEFGLSDVGLAKVCRRHKIPKPSRGYWAKLERGKKVEQWPLMPVDDESLQTIFFHKRETPATGNAKKPITVDPEIAALIEAESAPANQIRALTDLRGADPLVIATRESLSKQEVDEYGRVSSCRGSRSPCFEICVSKQNVQRALLLLHSLVRAFRDRGYRLHECDERSAQPYVEVLGKRFRVSVWEPSKQQKKELSKQKKAERERYPWSVRDYEYVPSGVLELHLNRNSYSSTGRIVDTNGAALELRLNQFIVRIFRAVKRARVAEEKQRLADAEAEALKRAAIDKEVIARMDDVRARRLLKAIPKWENAQRIKSFIDAVRTQALHRFGAIDAASEIGRWLRWAEQYLDSVDPLADGRELPTHSLTPRELEQLRKECDADWCSWSKTFQPRKPW